MRHEKGGESEKDAVRNQFLNVKQIRNLWQAEGRRVTEIGKKGSTPNSVKSAT